MKQLTCCSTNFQNGINGQTACNISSDGRKDLSYPKTRTRTKSVNVSLWPYSAHHVMQFHNTTSVLEDFFLDFQAEMCMQNQHTFLCLRFTIHNLLENGNTSREYFPNVWRSTNFTWILSCAHLHQRLFQYQWLFNDLFHALQRSKSDIMTWATQMQLYRLHQSSELETFNIMSILQKEQTKPEQNNPMTWAVSS